MVEIDGERAFVYYVDPNGLRRNWLECRRGLSAEALQSSPRSRRRFPRRRPPGRWHNGNQLLQTSIQGAGVADRVTVGVAARLSRYLQVLTQAKKMGKERISSQEISDYTNINATQIRRDLSGVREVRQARRRLQRRQPARRDPQDPAHAGAAQHRPRRRRPPRPGDRELADLRGARHQHRRRLRPRPRHDRPADRAQRRLGHRREVAQGRRPRQEHHRRRDRRPRRRARSRPPTSSSTPASGSSSTTPRRCSTSRTTSRCTRRTRPSSSCTPCISTSPNPAAATDMAGAAHYATR